MQIKKIILSNTLLVKVAIFFRRFYLKRKFGIIYGKGAFIGYSVICEGCNGFGANSTIVSSKIGFASYIGSDSKFAKTSIGRYSSIGPNVNCIFGRHPSDTFVSTHPSFFALKTPVNFTYVKQQLFDEYPKPLDEEGKYTISIGNDVWVGANVSILEGVTIGDGAIIAANALVNKNVDPYTIVGGVPAKTIKKRFNNDEIEFLLQLQWWNKSRSWIAKNAVTFNNIKKFKNIFKDE